MGKFLYFFQEKLIKNSLNFFDKVQISFLKFKVTAVKIFAVINKITISKRSFINITAFFKIFAIKKHLTRVKVLLNTKTVPGSQSTLTRLADGLGLKELSYFPLEKIRPKSLGPPLYLKNKLSNICFSFIALLYHQGRKMSIQFLKIFLKKFFAGSLYSITKKFIKILQKKELTFLNLW
ncbi:MAG: hypothetical protein KHZ27_06240 [Fusobacterium sp.]|nr:hypothetical protein [Fusobacterium sp.]